MATDILSQNIIHKAILRCFSNLKGNEYYLQQKGIAGLLLNCLFHMLQQQWTKISQKCPPPPHPFFFSWTWNNRFLVSIPWGLLQDDHHQQSAPAGQFQLSTWDKAPGHLDQKDPQWKQLDNQTQMTCKHSSSCPQIFFLIPYCPAIDRFIRLANLIDS